MSERKPTFFTSDLHIGHANSIVFDQRPFKDLEHMHRVLINNYNAVVPKDGICYFLGDIGLASTEVTKSVISQMNGTKVLVVGNHDKGYNAMYNIGFDVVMNSCSMTIANERVTLSHCPLLGVYREDVEGMKNSVSTENWHGESRHPMFSVKNEGQFHLHGHCHAGPANNKKVIDNKQMDIGVPGNKYRPVSISEIEAWIAKYKK